MIWIGDVDIGCRLLHAECDAVCFRYRQSVTELGLRYVDRAPGTFEVQSVGKLIDVPESRVRPADQDFMHLSVEVAQVKHRGAGTEEVVFVENAQFTQ
jgi:hypothetical protein